MAPPRVLLFGGDESTDRDRHLVADLVASRGGTVHWAATTAELARELESPDGWDLLYATIPPKSGPTLRALAVVHDSVPALPIVLELDARAEPLPESGCDLVHLVRCGASDLITDPRSTKAVAAALDRAVEVAQRRREWAATLDQGTITARGDLHVVTATGGGTGRTVMATNLAATLAGRGRRTCLIDLDHPFGGVALALQIAPRFTVVDAVTNDADELADVLSKLCHEVEPDLYALPAGREQDPAVSTTEVGTLVAAARRAFDHVVIDCPPTPHPTAVALVPAATSVWYVETPDLRSIRTLKVLIDGLGAAKIDLDRLQIVLNKYAPGLGITVNDLSETTGREPTIVIPYDRRIAQALNTGTPLAHRSNRDPLARSIRDRIAATLLAADPEPSATPGSVVSRERVLAATIGMTSALLLAAKGAGWI